MSAGFPANGTAKLYSDQGHTCIPKEVREAVGFNEGDELRFIAEDGKVVMIPEDSNQE